jgi:hypothetical protein
MFFTGSALAGAAVAARESEAAIAKHALDNFMWITPGSKRLALRGLFGGFTGRMSHHALTQCR